MHPLLIKTFGGLSKSYYFRQLFFGLLLFGFIMLMATGNTHGVSYFMVLICVLNSLLYPYTRFVYENIVRFITGNNMFVVNVFFMIFTKLMTMIICWGGAIFIAPIGLAYLYYYHSKN